MNTKDWVGLFLPALALAFAPTGASGEPAAPPSASASANAKPPPPPMVKGADIPAERSALPKPAEWAQAKEVTVNGDARCKVKLLREWLSVTCTDFYGAGLVAGDPKDVRVTAFGDPMQWLEAQQKMGESKVTVILPIERGKARIVNFLDLSGSQGSDYGPAMAGEGPTLHVWWRDGDAEPSLELVAARFH